MLLTNYSYINKQLGRQLGGLTSPITYIRPETMRNYYCQDSIENIDSIKKDSFTTGTYPPYSYVISEKGGLLSATTSLYGINLFENLNLAGGLNGESSVSGSGDINGQLSALAFLISSLSASSSLSADLNAAVSIAASLAGSGDLTGSLAALLDMIADLNGSGDLTGDLGSALYMVANLVGSGDLIAGIQAAVEVASNIIGTSDLTSSIIGNWNMIASVGGSGSLAADIEAVGNIISDLISSGTISLTSGAIPGDLSAIIESCSDLSPESLASAVWSALQTSINNPGTAGAALLAAGSAGDPWSTILPASYTGTQAGAILDRIQTLIDELHKIQGLDINNPMTVTHNSRTAGSIDLQITGDGVTTTTVSRQ